jgi:ubiquinone/menaquinone biosynthesis C-methylase UbiE
MTQNKIHWYDGWFYDKIIAPSQDQLFMEIKNIIEPQSNVIDVGCGTGRLAFELADHCKSVFGIDLSKKNIDRANLRLSRLPDDRISFHHLNLNEIPFGEQKYFDYVVMTYVIHEVNEEERIGLLKQMAQVSNKIILGDYIFPRPKGSDGFISKTIEFLAGREHYRNYKTYMAKGGIQYLANAAGLKIINEIKNRPSVSHIAILMK